MVFELAAAPVSSLGERFRIAVESGSFRDIVHLYAPDAAFEAILPGRRRTVSGALGIVAELSRWWKTPGRVVWWDEALFSSGLTIRFERVSVGDGRNGRSRQQHLIQTTGGIITKHVVLCDRPQLAPMEKPSRPSGDSGQSSALSSAVERDPLPHDGYSGNSLERLTMGDGTCFIVKHLSMRSNWIMRATKDPGREALLWSSRVFDHLPPEIQQPIVAVERETEGWALIMRDVSQLLFPRNAILTRPQTRRVLRAARALHENFRGERVDNLCRLVDRYRLFSPATVERERFSVDLVPKVDQRCWELFADIAPPDISDVVFTLIDDPSPLTDQLEACATTLIHGDLKPGNLGLPDDGVLAIDWGLACLAPPAVDLAWFLRFAFRMEASREDLIQDFRDVYGESHDERALQLALLGQMVMTGFRYSIDIVDSPDPIKRVECREAFDWWVQRAREALEVWAPT